MSRGHGRTVVNNKTTGCKDVVCGVLHKTYRYAVRAKDAQRLTGPASEFCFWILFLIVANFSEYLRFFSDKGGFTKILVILFSYSQWNDWALQDLFSSLYEQTIENWTKSTCGITEKPVRNPTSKFCLLIFMNVYR